MARCGSAERQSLHGFSPSHRERVPKAGEGWFRRLAAAYIGRTRHPARQRFPHPALRATFSRREKDSCGAMARCGSTELQSLYGFSLSHRERVPKAGEGCSRQLAAWPRTLRPAGPQQRPFLAWPGGQCGGPPPGSPTRTSTPGARTLQPVRPTPNTATSNSDTNAFIFITSSSSRKAVLARHRQSCRAGVLTVCPIFGSHGAPHRSDCSPSRLARVQCEHLMRRSRPANPDRWSNWHAARLRQPQVLPATLHCTRPPA